MDCGELSKSFAGYNRCACGRRKASAARRCLFCQTREELARDAERDVLLGEHARIAVDALVAIRPSSVRSLTTSPSGRPYRTFRASVDRYLVAAALRRLGWSWPLVGKALGYADHSTVFYGVRRVERDLELKEIIGRVEGAIRGEERRAA